MDATLLIALIAAAITITIFVVAALVMLRRRGGVDGAALAARAAEAEARLAEVREHYNQVVAERDRLREAERDMRTLAEVRKTEIDQLNIKLKDWEAVREQFMAGAKTALADTAATLSNKLLEDHKREANAAKEESEKRVKAATEALFKQFETVSNSVATLNERVGRNDELVDTVQRALSSPGGAGQLAEIGLENSLRTFGLKNGRDFLIQQTLEGDDGSRVRPDAVVFLPYDSALVVDCKASKFLFDLAAAEDDEARRAVGDKLRGTMRQHLRALAGRDYRAAILADYRRAGKSSELKRVLNIMYLPNEGAVEKISEIDPEFSTEAAEKGIIVLGPSGLMAMIAFARMEIDLGQQAENQEKIVEAARILLERTATTLGHAASMGKGLKSASDNYVKWVRSVNRNLLPATRSLESLGVRVDGKKLPQRLPTFEVVDVESEAYIEAEASELAAPESLPAPAPVLGNED